MKIKKILQLKKKSIENNTYNSLRDASLNINVSIISRLKFS
jgi:hypothetical protein